jgi:hypothetical protein
MKRTLLTVFSFVIMFCFVLTSFGSVQAYSEPTDPVVTPVSGDLEFTTQVVAPLTLGAAVVADGDRYLPAGYAKGDLQFIGNAVIVSGFDSGTATACFSNPGYRFGWIGNVYQWLNGKWNLLPTTTTEGVEDLSATACTTIYGSGTYALLAGYKTPEGGQCPKISFVSLGIFPYAEGMTLFGIAIVGDFPLTWAPAGTPVSFKISNISPAGSLSGPMTGSGEVTNGGTDPDGTFAVWMLPEGFDYEFTGEELPSFTVRVSVKGCHYDYHFPEDYFGANPE